MKPPPNPFPKPSFDVEQEKLKLTEQWLREEIRANRTQMLSLLQWGVTVLAGIETSLYYLRRDVMVHLKAAHYLKDDQLLPFGRWIIGTLFLLLVAWIFSSLQKHVIKRHVSYRTKLIEIAPQFSGIVEEPTGGKINKVPHLLFYLFPVFDLLLWGYFYVGEIWIKIPW